MQLYYPPAEPHEKIHALLNLNQALQCSEFRKLRYKESGGRSFFPPTEKKEETIRISLCNPIKSGLRSNQTFNIILLFLSY